MSVLCGEYSIWIQPQVMKGGIYHARASHLKVGFLSRKEEEAFLTIEKAKPERSEINTIALLFSLFKERKEQMAQIGI